jgi:hypothetical protein
VIIDSFSEPTTAGTPGTNQFGVMLRQQVEERLEFYKSGATPQKNLDVMAKVMAALGDAAGAPGNLHLFIHSLLCRSLSFYDHITQCRRQPFC